MAEEVVERLDELGLGQLAIDDDVEQDIKVGDEYLILSNVAASKYKGVNAAGKSGSRWNAKNGKKHLGVFDSAKKAARAYLKDVLEQEVTNLETQLREVKMKLANLE